MTRWTPARGTALAADKWRWTDEEGVQRLLSEDELRAALGDGRLQLSTLVWKRGMQSWLPASEVPELTSDIEATKIAPQSLKAGTKRKPKKRGGAAKAASRRGKKRASGAAGLIVSATSAPRLPKVPNFAKPDGAWAEGAARRDDDEQTITRIRLEDDDDDTLARKGVNTQPLTALPRTQTKRPPAPGRRAKGSSRPPPPPRGRKRIPKRVGRTLVSPHGLGVQPAKKPKVSVEAARTMARVSTRPMTPSGQAVPKVSIQPAKELTKTLASSELEQAQAAGPPADARTVIDDDEPTQMHVKPDPRASMPPQPR